MQKAKSRKILICLGVLSVALCSAALGQVPEVSTETDHQTPAMHTPTNPVDYFEIPVTNMDRAIRFYSAVFGFAIERETIDGHEMARFPLHEGAPGITGALAQGTIYQPTQKGVLIYFRTDSIEESLAAVVDSGGKVLYPYTDNGDLGFVAEFEDSEGNRIALHQAL